MRLKYKHVQKAGVENGRNRSCRKMQKMARAIGPEQYGAISFLDLFFFAWKLLEAWTLKLRESLGSPVH